jgi:hypothetical protein
MVKLYQIEGSRFFMNHTMTAVGLDKPSAYPQSTRKLSFFIGGNMGFPQDVKLEAVKYNIKKCGDFTCEYCHQTISSKEVEFDHVVPKFQQGLDNWDNIAIACPRCNIKKTKWSVEKFSAMISHKKIINCEHCLEFKEIGARCLKTNMIMNSKKQCRSYVVCIEDKTCLNP